MLKKISKYIVVLFVSLLMIPLIAKADMGAPETASYKVVVSDKDGINLYDWELKKIGTIPADEILEINWEEYKNDTLYGSTEYDGEYGYVKISETKLYKEEISPSDLDTDYNYSNGKMYVFGEGVKLYKGPSFAFDTVIDDDIKIGTTLEYTYKDDAWMYTEYKGKKGWVYYYSYSAGDYYKTSPVANVKKGTILTIDEISIYKDVTKNDKTGTTIPAGKEVKYKYSYYPYAKTTALYVEYDGVEGWVFKESYMGESDSSFLFKENAYIYISKDKEYTAYKDYKSSDKVGTIKGQKVYKYSYMYMKYTNDDYEMYYYMEYSDGKYGWVKLDYDEYSYQDLAIYETDEEVTLYSSPNKSDETEKTIKKGTKVKTLVTYEDSKGKKWVYVSDGDYEGWVEATLLTFIETYKLDEEEENEKPEEPIDPEEEKKKKKQKEDEEDAEASEMSTMQIVVIAVAGAVILALTVVIIIVLVNMKKGSKKKLKNK